MEARPWILKDHRKGLGGRALKYAGPVTLMRDNAPGFCAQRPRVGGPISTQAVDVSGRRPGSGWLCLFDKRGSIDKGGLEGLSL